MPYERFEIKLAGDETSGFYAEVLHAPGLRRTDHARLVLSDNEIRAWKKAMEQGSFSAEATLRLGRHLFEALFSGHILRLWESSLGAIGFDGGLRVRLDIRSSALSAIPWELMHDGYTYLAQTVATPVVRCLSNHRRPRHSDGNSKRAVLIVTATPSNAPRLSNVDAEAKAIVNILRSMKVACELLPHATRNSLQAKLREANYDIIHYIGHGVFDGRQGYLVLEDEAGRSDRFDSASLGRFLADTNVGLLFLNCCETAVPSPAETSQGAAEASLVVGIPTVVAMSAAVRDDVATEFAKEFYEMLVEPHSVEYCMAEARKAITRYEAPYWAIPVLFTNTGDEALRRSHRKPTEIIIEQDGDTNIVGNKVNYRG
jgi:hypothetical protein